MTAYIQKIEKLAEKLSSEGRVGELETLVQSVERDAQTAETRPVRQEAEELLRRVSFILNNYYASSPA